MADGVGDECTLPMGMPKIAAETSGDSATPAVTAPIHPPPDGLLNGFEDPLLDLDAYYIAIGDGAHPGDAGSV